MSIRFVFMLLWTLGFSEVALATVVYPSLGELEFPPQWGLGQAYDSRFGTFGDENCIEVHSVSYRGQQKAFVEVLTKHSALALEERMKSVLTGKLNLGWGLLKGSVSGSYLDESSANNFRLNTTYLVNHEHKSEVLDSYRLNAAATELLKQNRFDDFLKLCGTEFVIQKGLETSLAMNITIEFEEEKDREEYEIKLKASALWGAVKKTKRWGSVKNSLTEGAKFSVNVLQKGGEQEELKQILSKRHKNCLKDEVLECLATLKELMEYAGSEDGFIDNIKNPAASFFVTQPFERIAIELSDGSFYTFPARVEQQMVSFQMREQFERVGKIYQRYREQLLRANALLTQSLPEERLLSIQSTKSKIEQKQEEIADVLLNKCSREELLGDGYLACLDAATNIEESFFWPELGNQSP